MHTCDGATIKLVSNKQFVTVFLTSSPSEKRAHVSLDCDPDVRSRPIMGLGAV